MYVRREVAAAMTAHARRERPRECCGLLLGTAGEVQEAIPTANVAAQPDRRYQVSPADHVALMKRCRDASAQGSDAVEIIGTYHSHPRSAPVPSPTDRREALGDFLYIIVGPVDDSAPTDVRAYRLIEGEFENVALSGEAPSVSWSGRDPDGPAA